MDKKQSKSKLLDYSKLHLFGIEMAFLEFKEYHNLIEQNFIEEKERRRIAFEEFYKKETTKDFEYDAHLLTSYLDDYLRIDKYFPHSFRASFLIQLFSFVEFELKEICNHHHYLNLIPFSITDLKGTSDIDKAKLYLSKACGISFEDLNPEWNFINLIRKIRNKLVHHQGVISVKDSDWKVISDFVSANSFIEFQEEEFKSLKRRPREEYTILIVGKELNSIFLENIQVFFKKLLEEKLKYNS